ncbi:conserved hypothetical protein [Trichinella spiralis]|uniref:hypothetical protein n=1 Tax=Trichinella spiralis TaxID=6334 RepID=UPI0001EFB411|nr:conserved hypothetical protein [Trichinella spiralis]
MHAAYAMKPEVDDGTSAKVKEQKTNSNFPVSTEEIMDTKLSILNRPASDSEKYPNVHIDRSSSSSRLTATLLALLAYVRNRSKPFYKYFP